MFLHRSALFFILAFLLSIGFVLAQENQCDNLALQMWDDAAKNCEELGGNEACYALNKLNVDFVNPDDLPEDYFSEPGDFAELSELENVVPVVFEPNIPEWGVSIFNIQANIPDSLPGQYVKLFLMGNVNLENGVEPDDAFVRVHSIPVETSSGSNMYYFPRSDSEFIQTVPSGVKLTVDAISENGAWIRVAYKEKPGWITRNVLSDDSNAALLNLPMISEETQTAMQAFYFTTGIGNPRCTEAPTTILVQGPKNIEVDITANGARIRIASTIILRTRIEDGGVAMEVVPLSGEAHIFPDTPRELRVPAGEVAAICLTSDLQDLGIDNIVDDREVTSCDVREITEDEIASLAWVEEIPSRMLNYPIPYPPRLVAEPEETPVVEPSDLEITPLFNLPENCEPNSLWAGTYTVQVGDTLTWIAKQHGLTAYQLAEGNCIANPDLILPNQNLLVPAFPTPVPTLLPATPLPPPSSTPIPFFADLVTTITYISPLPGPMPLEPATYIITVTNNGPDTATGVTVANNVSGYLQLVTTTPSQGTYSSGTWNVGALPSGASATMTVTGEPLAGDGTTYNLTSVVSSPGVETVPSNNTASTNFIVQPIIVNTLTDTGTGGCTQAECTLREAVNLTNAVIPADTIGFSVSGTIVLGGTELSINSDVTINGGGVITVDGNASTRIFGIYPGTTATLNDMTITNGSFGGGGGGILVYNAALTVNNVTISGNTGTYGGGIASVGGTINVINSTISGNSASAGTGQGGGIVISSSDILSITGSNISNNTASEGGGVSSSGGTITINNSTISNNTASVNGGGVSGSSGAPINLSNVTITGNTAALGGGGIFYNNDGTVSADNSDITGNSPDDCDVPITDNGGNVTSPTCGFP